MRTIGFRLWNNKDPKSVVYVSHLPKGKGDWGYTKRIDGNENVLDKAIHLTPYWQKRFRADCRKVDYSAQFMTIA